MANAYESVTISTNSSVPVTGHASSVVAQEVAGNHYVPTFESILVIPKDTQYVISITDLKVDFDSDNAMEIVHDTTEVSIRVNDTTYTKCKRLGGTVKPSEIPINGKLLLEGTLVYKGYLWNVPA